MANSAFLTARDWLGSCRRSFYSPLKEGSEEMHRANRREESDSHVGPGIETSLTQVRAGEMKRVLRRADAHTFPNRPVESPKRSRSFTPIRSAMLRKRFEVGFEPCLT